MLNQIQYREDVRSVDQALKVTAATITKVPFDLDRWARVAQERYPDGLPHPYSDDPTQWIFHGHPCGAVIWDEAAKWDRPWLASHRRRSVAGRRRAPARLPLAGRTR